MYCTKKYSKIRRGVSFQKRMRWMHAKTESVREGRTEPDDINPGGSSAVQRGAAAWRKCRGHSGNGAVGVSACAVRDSAAAA